MNLRSGRITRSLPALLLAFGLIAASCGTDDTVTAVDSGDSSTDTSSAADAAASTDEVTSDESASGVGPGVVLSTVSGGQIDFGSLEGTDTILWYWAPW